MEPFIWTGNYKITMKRETVLSKSVSWKPRKTSEEQAGRSNLSYKREKKSGDWYQTDRQTKYCNPRAHARRALIKSLQKLIAALTHAISAPRVVPNECALVNK